MAGRPLDQQTDGLKAVAHDVFRLGVAGRLLMEQLDGGHLAAFFRALMPSARQTSRSPTATGSKSRKHSRAQQAVSASRSRARL
jgi:hypothetical protein